MEWKISYVKQNKPGLRRQTPYFVSCVGPTLKFLSVCNKTKEEITRREEELLRESLSVEKEKVTKENKGTE